MYFGIGGMDRLTLKHDTLNSLLTIYFYSGSLKYFWNPNYIYTLAKGLFLILGLIKYSLTSSALQAFVPPNLLLLQLYSPILSICIFSLSTNLNRLNALSACHKLEPIDNAQNLSSSFICRDKHSTPTSLIKVPSMKVGVYLIFQDQNTSFTDPT